MGYILCRNCFLQRVIEGKIREGVIRVTGRRGRRCRRLLANLKERRGYSHLKEEALDSTMWRTRFGRGFGPIVRQTTKLINKLRITIDSNTFPFLMFMGQCIVIIFYYIISTRCTSHRVYFI